MKRSKIAMAIVAMAFGIVGCNNNTDGWYPISGGYINLRNVHTITSGFSDRPLVQEQPITKESIALCKKRVAESKDVPIISKAWIKFDDITINLPTDAKSKKDVLRLLDLYLDTVESLELPTKLGDQNGTKSFREETTSFMGGILRSDVRAFCHSHGRMDGDCRR